MPNELTLCLRMNGDIESGRTGMETTLQFVCGQLDGDAGDTVYDGALSMNRISKKNGMPVT